MHDFAALPPEINSARMYSGPGSGPMMSAAAAWDGLAGQLDSFAGGYSSVLSSLQGQNWSGPSSAAMAAAASPYMAWAATTAAQAVQAANQARAAAAAYEAAFAATVPPAAVAANRTQLATLVATNFFGQNAPAIAATEAAYAEMWAQDATAMYGYAASSTPATALAPFTEPPQTTNPAGSSNQAAAVSHAAGTSGAGDTQSVLSQAISALPQQLQGLSTAGSLGSLTSVGPSSLLSGVGNLTTLLGPLNFGAAVARTLGSGANFGIEIQRATDAPPLDFPKGTGGISAPGSAGVRGAVLANTGEATPVGRLSVPQAWTAATSATGPGVAPPKPSTTPGLRLVSAQTAEPPANTAGGTQPASIAPMQGMAERHGGNAVFRMRDRRFRMPRPAAGG
jgi:PPE-repeat protein